MPGAVAQAEANGAKLLSEVCAFILFVWYSLHFCLTFFAR